MIKVVDNLASRIESKIVHLWMNEFSDIDQLIDEFIHMMIKEPIKLSLSMKQFYLFDNKNFGISYRRCDTKLLKYILELVNVHYSQEKMFEVSVGAGGYTVDFSSFKYNAVLDQRISRMQLIRLFIKTLVSAHPDTTLARRIILDQFRQNINIKTHSNDPLVRKIKKHIL